MIVLDENIPDLQRKLLSKGRIRTQQIGEDIGRKGLQDAEDIIPLLHSLNYPVLVTRDLGFYKKKFCHRGYCILCLNVTERLIARFVRKFYRHLNFKTRANRMGKVVRLSPRTIHYWVLKRQQEISVGWNEK